MAPHCAPRAGGGHGTRVVVWAAGPPSVAKRANGIVADRDGHAPYRRYSRLDFFASLEYRAVLGSADCDRAAIETRRVELSHEQCI